MHALRNGFLIVSASVFALACQQQREQEPAPEQREGELAPAQPEGEQPMGRMGEQEQPMMGEREQPMMGEREQPMMGEREQPMMGEQEQPTMGQPPPQPTGPEYAAQGPERLSVESITSIGQASLVDDNGQTVGQVELIPVPVGIALHVQGSQFVPGPIDVDVRPDESCEQLLAQQQQQTGEQRPMLAQRMTKDMIELQADPSGSADLYFVIPGGNLESGQPGSLIGRENKAAVLVQMGAEGTAARPMGQPQAEGPTFACGEVSLSQQGEQQQGQQPQREAEMEAEQPEPEQPEQMYDE